LLFFALTACGRIDFDPVPGAVVTNTSTQLVVGSQDACVLTDGDLFCWGYNDAGQLGTNAAMIQATPIAVGTGHHWIEVALGREFMCALDDAHEAWCWGGYSTDQLGLASRSCGDGNVDVGEACDDANQQNGDGCDCMCQMTAAPSPIPEPQQLPDRFQFAHLFSGRSHTCGIRLDGTLWCWGRNGARQLGVGDGGGTADHSVPIQVVIVAPQIGRDDDWVQVGPGDDHTCGVKQDGSLWCWGSNGNGQLGQMGNPAIVRERPELVLGGATSSYTAVQGGIDYECARGSDAQIYCLGRNDFHQLGLGTVTDSPVPVPTTTGEIDAVAVGTTHACALRHDHVILCWGENLNGEAGDPGGADQMLPRAMPGTWKTVDVGEKTSCALDENGLPWCWGSGGFGQLGNGMMLDSTVPVAVCRDPTCSAN